MRHCILTKLACVSCTHSVCKHFPRTFRPWMRNKDKGFSNTSSQVPHGDHSTLLRLLRLSQFLWEGLQSPWYPLVTFLWSLLTLKPCRNFETSHLKPQVSSSFSSLFRQGILCSTGYLATSFWGLSLYLPSCCKHAWIAGCATPHPVCTWALGVGWSGVLDFSPHACMACAVSTDPSPQPWFRLLRR